MEEAMYTALHSCLRGTEGVLGHIFVSQNYGSFVVGQRRVGLRDPVVCCGCCLP